MADYPPQTCERLARSDIMGCPFAGQAGGGEAGRRQGLTLVPISAQLELTFPLSAQLKLHINQISP